MLKVVVWSLFSLPTLLLMSRLPLQLSFARQRVPYWTEAMQRDLKKTEFSENRGYAHTSCRAVRWQPRHPSVEILGRAGVAQVAGRR